MVQYFGSHHASSSTGSLPWQRWYDLAMGPFCVWGGGVNFFKPRNIVEGHLPQLPAVNTGKPGAPPCRWAIFAHVGLDKAIGGFLPRRKGQTSMFPGRG